MSDNLLFTNNPHGHRPRIPYVDKDGDLRYLQPNPDSSLWREFMDRFQKMAEVEFFSINPEARKVVSEK